MNRYQQLAEPLTLPDGTTYLSGLQYLDFLYSGQVQYYECKYQDIGRIDLISYKWLGDASLYWVICLLNNIIDPLVEIQQGTVLAIPTSPLGSNNFEPFTYIGT